MKRYIEILEDKIEELQFDSENSYATKESYMYLKGRIDGLKDAKKEYEMRQKEDMKGTQEDLEKFWEG